MKRATYIMAAAIAVLGLAGVAPLARAANTAPAGPAATAPDRDGPLAERREILQDIREALASLNLTDDQKTKIKDVVEDFRKLREDYRADHKAELEPLLKDLKAAHEAKNEEQVKADLEKIRVIMEAGPKPRELLMKLAALLTPEQRKDFRAAMQKLRQEDTDAAPATQK